LCKTLGYNNWQTLYEVIIVGKADQVFEILRQNFAIAWMMMMSILLHGACYDFVYVAGQVYIDSKATPAIRAQGQGLFVMISYGIGQGLGTIAGGQIFNSIMSEGQSLQQWQTFWIIPLIFAVLVTLMFAFGFRNGS